MKEIAFLTLCVCAMALVLSVGFHFTGCGPSELLEKYHLKPMVSMQR